MANIAMDSIRTSVFSKISATQQQELPRFPSTIPPAQSSPCVSRSSRGRQPANERFYNLGTHEKKDTRRSTSCPRRLGVLSAHERLYSFAKEKRAVEEERRAATLLRKEQLENERPKGLQLAARSYTPIRDRSSSEHKTVHSRLYSLAKVKKNELEQQHQMKNQEDTQRSLDPNKFKSTVGIDRLYNRSVKKQQLGQERRKRIELDKVKPIRPSGKISLGKASGIYDRGMKQKMNLETKRENEGVSLYVSPLLNPLLIREIDDGDHQSQADSRMPRSRASSVSGSRSQRSQSTTGRQGRSNTPVNSRSRSRTPVNTRDMNIVSLPTKSTTSTPTSDGKRIRARSRLRSATPTIFSFRSASPAPAPRVPNTISKSTSTLSGHSATSQRGGRRSATPQREGPPGTPKSGSRAPRRVVKSSSSSKDLLRKMKDDVEFYKSVKQALAEKEKETAASGNTPTSAELGQGGNLDDANSNATLQSITNSSHEDANFISVMPPIEMKKSDNSMLHSITNTQISNEDENFTSFVGRVLPVNPRSNDYRDDLESS